MSTVWRHLDFAVWAENTAVIATFDQPTLLFSYLKTWKGLRAVATGFRIAISFSKDTAMTQYGGSMLLSVLE
jgi:hypothetical protein